MKHIDLLESFDSRDAEVALLSTFNFDPGFFERELLSRRALRRCRHVLVLMDSDRWRALCQKGIESERLNRHYHVIPVSRQLGVFHPKLHVLLGEAGGTLICGSHNLSHTGFTNNLELTAAVHMDAANVEPGLARVLNHAVTFFQQVIAREGGFHREVASQWLDGLETAYPWLKIEADESNVRLIHSGPNVPPDGLEGDQQIPLLERLEQVWDGELQELDILSPYYDADLSTLREIQLRYPQANISITAQEFTTSLPAEILARDFPGITLFGVQSDSRRLHGKLLSWRASGRRGYLAGSANFTSAALKGANTEACLLVEDREDPFVSLFADDVPRLPIAASQFTPGTTSSPEQEAKPKGSPLELLSAVIDTEQQLKICLMEEEPAQLEAEILLRNAGDTTAFLTFPWRSTGRQHKIALSPENLAGIRGAVVASVRAKIDGAPQEGPPLYVVQESKLERDFGTSSFERARKRIEESGDGLADFLADLAKRGDERAYIDFLMNTKMRYRDGAGRRKHSPRPFRVIIRDPTRSNDMPAWLLNSGTPQRVAEAIDHFVRVHEQGPLRRHARTGNVNGIENFVDIFRTVIGLAFRAHQQGVVPNAKMIAWAIRYVRRACIGYEERGNWHPGFVAAVANNLGANRKDLVLQANEHKFAAHLRATLLIAQVIRWSEGDLTGYSRAADCQPKALEELRTALQKASIFWPTADATVEALAGYGALTDDEVAEWRQQLVGAR